jgi:hypothetical protein
MAHIWQPFSRCPSLRSVITRVKWLVVALSPQVPLSQKTLCRCINFFEALLRRVLVDTSEARVFFVALELVLKLS